MAKFAKVFDVGDDQVLVYTEYEADEDHTRMHIIAHVKGVQIDQSPCFTGADQDKNANSALEKFDQTTAQKMYDAALAMMRDVTAEAAEEDEE